MGSGSVWTARLGGVLEKLNRGKWVSGRPAEAGVYVFLFGPSGLEWADALPSRKALQAEGPGELRLIGIVDDLRALERLRDKGHPAVCLSALIDAEEDPNRACDFLVGLCKALSATYRPVDALFSACFANQFPRARRFMDECGLGLTSGKGPGPGRGLRFLAGEIPDEWTKIAALVEHCGVAAEWLVAGNPLYFDHGQYLAAISNLAVEYMGWRRRPEKTNVGGLRLEFNDPRFGGEVARLAPAQQNRAEVDALITDGSVPLLPQLAAGRPVILLRSRFARPGRLARVSYFEGQGRWPVFAGLSELAQAWERDGINAIWRPFAGRQCSLEREPGPRVSDAFIGKIYKPLLSKAGR